MLRTGSRDLRVSLSAETTADPFLAWTYFNAHTTCVHCSHRTKSRLTTYSSGRLHTTATSCRQGASLTVSLHTGFTLQRTRTVVIIRLLGPFLARVTLQATGRWE